MRVVTLFAICVALLMMGITAFAAIPPMISYQGKLTKADGTLLPDGTYSMRFAIYTVPTAGDMIWSETNPAVQVKKGLFSVLLGSVVNLPGNIFDSTDRYFGVKVGDDTEMTPRQQIASVPFAFRAASAANADNAVTAATATTAGIADTVKDGAVTAEKIAPDQSLTLKEITGSWDKSSQGYIRLGDFQICWGESGWGGSDVRVVSSDVVFPVQFVTKPSVTITSQWANVVERYGISANSVGNTGFSAFAKIDTNGTSSVGFSWTAIGRWR